MFLIDQLLLLGGILMILGIITSKFSARFGFPVLVAFIGLGMLAGTDGVGRIEFDDYRLAHAVGTVALSFILFDGGLRTPVSSLLSAWKPALALATVGVLLTSAIVGVAAMWVLDLTLLEGMLVGSIVGSTDAAAVFGQLRSAGVHLHRRLGATLELESGANDPMAIFLTMGLIQVLTGESTFGMDLVLLFVLQIGVGFVVGVGIGKLSVILINRIDLGAAGLYPVLTGACGALAFGTAALLGGSGFLAIYVAGIVLGNGNIVFRKGTLLFHDGIAWAGQIVMFVALGLLSFPSSLIDVAVPSIMVAAVLIFVARPLAVIPVLAPFGFSRREVAMVSWVGLKGAVPIILATFPLMAGLPKGPLVFNVVFFVVLTSALVQGGTLAWAARRLKLEEPPIKEPPISLEVLSIKNVDAEIVDYVVGAESVVAGRLVRELGLPEGAVVAMVAREKELIPPRGSTQLRSGDHVFVVVNHGARCPVDAIFSRNRGDNPAYIPFEFSLRGSMTFETLRTIYGFELPDEPDTTTIEAYVAGAMTHLEPGVELAVGNVRLRLRDVIGGRLVSVAVVTPDVGGVSDSARCRA